MILSNQVRCKHCGDEPYSAHRHDFKCCKCGALAVDGGMDYLRRIGDLKAGEDMSIEWPDSVVAALRKGVEDAIESNRNSLGIVCAVARILRDNGATVSFVGEDQ